MNFVRLNISVYFKIFCKLLKNIFLYVLALAIVLLVRVVRPFVLIRFGIIPYDRIGHLGTETELYLCERDLRMQEKAFDIFSYSRPVANKQLLKMFKRLLHASRFTSKVPIVNQRLPGYEAYEVPRIKNRDVNDLLIRIQPHISFTPEEMRLGQSALCNMGISENTPFVCMHARESNYLDTVLPKTDWDYHNHRNSSIHNFIAAANELTNRGYFAIRTGANCTESLNTTNSKIIDYAMKHRTEFLDIFLLANCRFLIGSPCGYTHLAYDLFRKPLVCVDFSCLEYVYTWSDKCLFIPKKLWLRKEHRFMRFREIFDSGVGTFFRTEFYAENGIEIVDNTPEEISAVAIEMDERLKGKWMATDEDEKLQNLFWDMFPESELHGVIRSRIGAEFLRQNKGLLD
jgi:putative glycosyltransferase (TIGR04372 family)